MQLAISQVGFTCSWFGGLVMIIKSQLMSSYHILRIISSSIAKFSVIIIYY